MVLSEKVIKSINKYLSISSKYNISIGVIMGNDCYTTTISNGNKIDDELYYDIGSISKTFTAHMILKCVNAGLINLDDKLDKYIKLKEKEYPTIRELLSHSCGFNHITPVEIVVPALLSRRYSKRNIYENITNDRIISLLNKKRLSKKRYYSYSDFNYAILGVVLSSIYNKPFGELMSEFIKDELKLENTDVSYNVNRNLDGYIKNKKVKFWKWNKNNPYISGGGIASTIQDMVKYINIQINSNEGYITDCHVPQKFQSKSNIIPCLGWHTYDNSNQLWHVGGVGTFRSSVIINKHKKIGVVVLGNASGRKSANVHYITKLIYSEIKRRKIKIK